VGDFFCVAFFQIAGNRTTIMARKERKYKRLPGRPVTPFEARSLWQGPDHLLWVESVFFKERYKRFYYTDIQAVVLQRTGMHRFWSGIWGSLTLLCGLIASLMTGPPLISGAFTAIFLLLLVTNILLGPACKVYLQTAVQLHRISSLVRVRTARKTVDRIKTLVEAVQGPWDKNSLKTGTASARASASKDSVTDPPAATLDRGLEAPFKPLLHQILFGLLLVLGALGATQFQIKSLALAILETLLHLSVQVIVIVALTRWYSQIRGALIVKINWIALVFITIFSIIGYGLYLAASFSNPQINYYHWAMFKKVFELQWFEHPVTLVGNILYACGNLLLGIFGWLVLQRFSTGPNP
jgi:hypothetical protein